MPDPIFSTEFDPHALRAGQGVLFRIPEYLELELGTVTGPPEKSVSVWRVPVRAEAGVRLVPFREIAAAEVNE